MVERAICHDPQTIGAPAGQRPMDRPGDRRVPNLQPHLGTLLTLADYQRHEEAARYGGNSYPGMASPQQNGVAGPDCEERAAALAYDNCGEVGGGYGIVLQMDREKQAHRRSGAEEVGRSERSWRAWLDQKLRHSQPRGAEREPKECRCGSYDVAYVQYGQHQEP